MANLKTLQQIIDGKAEQRLKNDLQQIRSKIFECPVLLETGSEFPSLEFGGKEIKPYWFFNTDEPFCKALYSYWLPIYKSKEAEMFVKEVEQLKEGVDNLMSSQTYD